MYSIELPFVCGVNVVFFKGFASASASAMAMSQPYHNHAYLLTVHSGKTERAILMHVPLLPPLPLPMRLLRPIFVGHGRGRP